jgi:hypothetical protein
MGFPHGSDSTFPYLSLIPHTQSISHTPFCPPPGKNCWAVKC